MLPGAHDLPFGKFQSLISTFSIAADAWLYFAGLHIHVPGGNDSQADRVQVSWLHQKPLEHF